jgi:hypothetical protein
LIANTAKLIAIQPAFRRERAGPDEDRQADGENGQRVGQQRGLGVERQTGVGAPSAGVFCRRSANKD